MSLHPFRYAGFATGKKARALRDGNDSGANHCAERAGAVAAQLAGAASQIRTGLRSGSEFRSNPEG